MQKSIFPTKIKDGLFVLTIALVVMGGSLYVDAVKGVLRGPRFRVTIYLEGTTVEEKLIEGNMVNIFRRAVGKIDRVSFDTAEVLRQSEIGRAKLDEVAGSPQQMARLREMQHQLSRQTEIVMGVKLECVLYKDLIGPLMPLFGPRSEARIAAAGMMGEPFLQLNPGDEGGGLSDGDRIGFPKNDPSLVAAGQVPVLGSELATPEDVTAALSRKADFKKHQAEFEKLLEEIAGSVAGAPAPAAPAGPAPASPPTTGH